MIVFSLSIINKYDEDLIIKSIESIKKQTIKVDKIILHIPIAFEYSYYVYINISDMLNNYCTTNNVKIIRRPDCIYVNSFLPSWYYYRKINFEYLITGYDIEYPINFIELLVNNHIDNDITCFFKTNNSDTINFFGTLINKKFIDNNIDDIFNFLYEKKNIHSDYRNKILYFMNLFFLQKKYRINYLTNNEIKTNQII
jgi:hypothetical protein